MLSVPVISPLTSATMNTTRAASATTSAAAAGRLDPCGRGDQQTDDGSSKRDVCGKERRKAGSEQPTVAGVEQASGCPQQPTGDPGGCSSSMRSCMMSASATRERGGQPSRISACFLSRSQRALMMLVRSRVATRSDGCGAEAWACAVIDTVSLDGVQVELDTVGVMKDHEPSNGGVDHR